MPRYLVTGATGFIGCRLVKQLRDLGHEVVCIVRGSSDTTSIQALGAMIERCGLEDPLALSGLLQGTDYVIHLAGKTRGRTLEEFLPTNQGAVEKICQAASRLENPPSVVLVSSLAAVGPSLPEQAHDEATRANPISHYGKSKLLGERAGRALGHQVPISIVRPPVVFGPGDRGGLMMCQAIRRFGFHFVPQLEGLPLSLVHSDDLVNALISVAERGQRVNGHATHEDDSQGVYFAADPQPSTYAEVGRMIGQAMGKNVWVLCRRKYPLLLPALVSDLWGRLRGKPSLFGMDKLREASATGWVCDSGKITTELGWSPTTSLAERYRETVAWYQEAGWL